MQSYDAPPTEDTVLSVLSGTPIEQAANRARTSCAQLASAIERYRAAGRAALEQQPSHWHQMNIQFSDYTAAAHTFRTCLLPALHNGAVGAWWFVRKNPYWRLRVHPSQGTHTENTITHMTQALETAVTRGAVKEWRSSLYEPETIAFGGPEGMALAHDLFHTDSENIFEYDQHYEGRRNGTPDAKATSLLLIALFLRAAGLEWGEQGDVWGQIEARRPLPADVPRDKVSGMVGAMRQLLTSDTGPALTNNSLSPLRNWVNGMESGGRSLKDAAAEGRLTLGLRAILARHALFHWNRMGFTVRQQAIWARAAREAVFGE